MGLKLIGAVGVKVRPEAEDFRDEAERQIKRQLKDGYTIPAEVKPELDEEKLRRDLERHKQTMQRELRNLSKGISFEVPEIESSKFTRSSQQILTEHKKLHKQLDDVTKKSVETRRKAEAKFYETSFASTSGLKGRQAILEAAEAFRDAAEQVTASQGELDRESSRAIRRYVANLNKARDALKEVYSRQDLIEKASFQKPSKALRQLAHEGDQVSSVFESVSQAVREVGVGKVTKKLHVDSNLLDVWKDAQRFRHEWEKIPADGRKALAVKLQVEDNDAIEATEKHINALRERLSNLSAAELKQALSDARSQGDQYLAEFENAWRSRLSRARRVNEKWERQSSIDTGLEYEDLSVFKEMQKRIDSLGKSIKNLGVGDLRRQMKQLSEDLTEQEVTEVKRLAKTSGLAEEELQRQLLDRKKILRDIYADEWQSRRRAMLGSGTVNGPGNTTTDWQDQLTPSDNDWHRIKREFETNSQAIIRDSFGNEIKNVERWLKRHAGDALAEMRDRARIEQGAWDKANIDKQALENRRIEQEFARHQRALQAEAEQSKSAWDGLRFGMEQYRARIAKTVQDLARGIDSRVPINMEFDPKSTDHMENRFKDALERMRHRFRQVVNDMDGATAEIKPTLDESAHRIAWARLKWLTRDRIAWIHAQVSPSSVRLAKNALEALYGMSGARTGIDFVKDLGQYIRDLDKKVPAIAMLGTAAISAMGGIIALAGSISNLSMEIVRMSGLALAAPGILGGFAVGIGAFIAVIKDLPTEVPKITKDLGALRDEMSSNFWGVARAPMLDAWNKAFPHFSKGIKETSSALGRWTAAFSEAFATNFDMAAFDKMFGNLNRSIDIASIGVQDMVKSMSILGQTGSEYLPRLAQWSNEVAAGFANWLEESQKSGKLNQYIETGIVKLKDFGKLVRESGELVYILGSAAERAGFSGFGEMADGMERFNDALSSSDGQRVLDDLFYGAGRVADGFKRALNAVSDFVWNSSDLLKDLMVITGDTIGRTFEDLFKSFERPQFQNGLRDLFSGVDDGLKSITDQSPVISDLLGSIGSLAGSVASNMGKVVGKVLEVFGPEVSDALSDIAPDIDSIGGSLESMIDSADELNLDDLVGDIIRLAGAGVAQVAADLAALGTSLEAVSKVSQGDFSGLDEVQEKINKDVDDRKSGKKGWTILDQLPVVGDFFRGIGDWAAQIGQSVGTFSDDLWGSIQDAFGFEGAFALDDWFPDLGADISKWWNEQIAEITGLWGTITSTLSGWWDSLTQWISELFSGNGSSGGLAESQGTTSLLDGFNFDGIGDELAKKIETAKGWLSEKWNGFTGWLGELFGGGGSGGPIQVAIDFVMGAVDNASGVIETVKTKAGELKDGAWQLILSALDNASNIVETAKNRAKQFADGAYQAVIRARDAASALIDTVKRRAREFANGAYQAVMRARDSASQIIAGVRSKADSYGSLVKTATLKALDKASSVINRVKSNLAGLRDKTINVVTNVITKVKKVFSADGNYLPGVEHYANGGIRNEQHVAQIAPAGAMRVWAEPETGGEAYIPLAESKRTRSEQILATVADKFGMRLERYANGSDPSSRSVDIAAGGDTYNLNIESVPSDSAEEVSDALMFNLKHMKRGGGNGFA